MPKFFVSTNQINGNEIIIQNEDVNHIKNVLRAKIKDKIDICDHKTSKNYLCEISQIEDNKILCQIINEKESGVESNVYLSIFQGLPKADKMELVIQKSVELGVYDITPLKMKRCVVKLKEKDEKKKIERWQKISEVAAKQSGRDIILGPEGGIDENEIQTFKSNGAKIITLGKRILRTETVALNVASIIMYELEQS